LSTDNQRGDSMGGLGVGDAYLLHALEHVVLLELDVVAHHLLHRSVQFAAVDESVLVARRVARFVGRLTRVLQTEAANNNNNNNNNNNKKNNN
jgi:hypothetical protein